MCTTNLQTPIAICCTRLLTLTMLKTPFHFLNSSDFTNKSVRQFFKNRGYPDSVVKTAQERAQTTNQQAAPQTSQKDENQRIPFTLTFHPLNLPVKNIILKNLLQNDNETSRNFSLPPLISFKRNKNISDFLVRSTLKSDESPGTFNCTRKRCKTCPFIHNTDKVTGPKRSIKITDRFTCTSASVIYCIKCTLCKKIYIGEAGRRLGDRVQYSLRRRANARNVGLRIFYGG